MVETVERVVDCPNAVEHPEGHSGTVKIRKFRLDPNGKFSVPAWWIERDGTAGVESPSGNLPSCRNARRASPREDKGSCRRELRPVEAPPLCPCDPPPPLCSDIRINACT